MSVSANHPHLAYWLCLANAPKLSPRVAITLVETLGGIHALFAQLSALPQGLSPATLAYLHQADWAAYAAICRWTQAENKHIICWEDHDYPPLLRELAVPPLVLYVQGQRDTLNKPQLAMVGSRQASIGGKENAFHIAQQLVKTGLLITSGLALGIDAASHQGALAGQGQTVAVLGAGLHHIYPKQHQALADAICQQGALVSEFPLHAPPQAWHFPRRNRIMTGLCHGVLVVEASVASGSLISARYALEQGREVFAIPGSIHNPLSRGCHALLKDGATLVESSDDIIAALQPVLPWLDCVAADEDMGQARGMLSSLQEKLIQYIGFELTSVDKIILRSGLTAQAVCSMLPYLVMAGYIAAVPGGYIRNK